MGIEEKAKAYEMALEAARKELGVDRKEWKVVEHVLCNIFHELRESEDERIRRTLVEYFGPEVQLDFVRGVPIQKIRDWLEKQKEQKPVEIHIDNPNIQKFDPDVKVTTSDSSSDGKELLYVSNKSYNIGYRDGVASAKQEWSEEDEKDIAHIIRILDDCYAYGKHDLSKTDHENLVNKLKSLRPSWKPSEEQMTAILRAEGVLRLHEQEEVAKRLAELYEQLKRL